MRSRCASSLVGFLRCEIPSAALYAAALVLVTAFALASVVSAGTWTKVCASVAAGR